PRSEDESQISSRPARQHQPRPPPESEKLKRQLARLCDLEPGPSPRRQLARKDEKHLLLGLCTVNKTIRRWEQEERGCELDKVLLRIAIVIYLFDC
uniref:Uncharacterized protein n=1 Tax=Setaria italica TaxID=4555 RepID=K3YY65_SETIT